MMIHEKLRSKFLSFFLSCCSVVPNNLVFILNPRKEVQGKGLVWCYWSEVVPWLELNIVLFQNFDIFPLFQSINKQQHIKGKTKQKTPYFTDLINVIYYYINLIVQYKWIDFGKKKMYPIILHFSGCSLKKNCSCHILLSTLERHY